jgi:MarR family transcriptional regulator, temperature-dependent positive regulator of motility
MKPAKGAPLTFYPAEDLTRHPGHLLRRALQVMNLLWAEEVSRTITSPQFAALNALHNEPNIDQRTLGEQISLDRSTMADVVARLTERGAVEWSRDARDGRRKTIRLTAKGERTLQELIPRTHRMTNRLVTALDCDEQEKLLSLLKLIVTAHEGKAV